MGLPFLLAVLCFFVLPQQGMQKKVEQRANIKFLCAAGKTPIECWRALQAVYGHDCLSQMQVRVWHHRFRGGDTDIKDKMRSGRKRTVRVCRNINRIEAHLEKDRRGSVRQLADETGVKKSTLHKILRKDLHRKKVSCKFIPRILMQEQKDFRVKLCKENLGRLRADSHFLEHLICGDESSIPLYDPETKCATNQWKRSGEPRPQKALRGRAKKSSMLICFFDSYSVIHQQFMPKGVTVTKEEYCRILDDLKQDIRRKRPGMWKGGRDGNTDRDFVLQHDNASSHTAIITLAKIGESGIDLLAHPPYSPDLAVADYFLFPHLKSLLRGQEFPNIEAMQAETHRQLLNIDRDLLKKAFLDLPKQWLKCVKSGGDYFEGHHLDVEQEYADLDISSSSEEESENDSEEAESDFESDAF